MKFVRYGNQVLYGSHFTCIREYSILNLKILLAIYSRNKQTCFMKCLIIHNLNGPIALMKL